jgi:D-amino-acid dehydrogenase
MAGHSFFRVPAVKILVLGSGVIGVTSAWYLQRAGHEVTVLDRQPGPGLETSFANGGQISWGAANPWAAPGLPLAALRWLLRRHSPLALRPRLDPVLWSWLGRMLRNCTAKRYLAHKERLLRLGRYSHQCLTELRQALGLHYDQRTDGMLILYRRSQDLDAAARELPLFVAHGIRCRLLGRDGCVVQEPALAAAPGPIAGGLHFRDDESGDCHAFSRALAEHCERAGVRFVFGASVTRLAAEGDRIVNVLTDRGALAADAYVLACGSYSPLLLRPLGIRLPVYPVKGYSLTLPITDDSGAPRATLTDEHYKTVITRLGNRLRAAGTAELAGYDLRLRRARLETLAHVVRELFPRAGDLAGAEYWAGLRPMTPDNPPVLGVTSYRNLFLNTGHGTLGWTLSCGSARVLCDLISGRRPEIDLEGLTLTRFE